MNLSRRRLLALAVASVAGGAVAVILRAESRLREGLAVGLEKSGSGPA